MEALLIKKKQKNKMEALKTTPLFLSFQHFLNHNYLFCICRLDDLLKDQAIGIRSLILFFFCLSEPYGLKRSLCDSSPERDDNARDKK